MAQSGAEAHDVQDVAFQDSSITARDWYGGDFEVFCRDKIY